MALLSMGCPNDEYDPEIERVVADLWNCRTKEDVRDLLYRVFVEMFDESIVNSPEKYQKPAHEIYEQLISKH
jgi:hypothetical protein